MATTYEDLARVADGSSYAESWSAAFEEAGEAMDLGPVKQAVVDFAVGDIAEVLAAYEDSPEGYASTDMAGVFRLTDGRYGCIVGWCDTSGWDCQSSASKYVSSSLEEVHRRGLGDEERGRLGIQLTT